MINMTMSQCLVFNASFASDIINDFQEKAILFHGTFHRLKFTTAITQKISETNSRKTHHGKRFISVFQEISASINKTLIFAGGLGTTLSYYEV